MKTYKNIDLLTQNKSILNILSRIKKIATSNFPVLIIGETGVGKELFSEYIHHSSQRASEPLIKVGLSTLPSDLLESELFGHERGAFTNSAGEKKGLFELADNGTIFLDDIDDFPLHLQSKLLRVIESQEIMRIGSEAPLKLNIRLITASKIELKELVEKELFRKDLFYRINVIPIYIPPLRERLDDIPLLVNFFINKYSANKNLSISKDALKALMRYQWPGNLRELRNVVQRATLFCNDEILTNDLPAEIIEEHPLTILIKACSHCFGTEKKSFESVMDCLELHLLQNALREAEGNQSRAAKSLQLSLSTFRDKLKKHNLDHSKYQIITNN